jgi:bifunctional enzyme CysN/CysC
MNIVVVGPRRSRQEHRGRPPARRHGLAARRQAGGRAQECLRTGKPFEYAFLLDALSDEQDQGITIDTARCFFKTASATTSSSTPRGTSSSSRT